MIVDWEFDHAGVVVRDLENVARHYARIGINMVVPPHPEVLDTPSAPIKFRACFIENNAIRLKLIQPGPGNNMFTGYLDNFNEGVYYLGFRVKNLNEASAGLAGSGFPVIAHIKKPDGSITAHLFNTAQVGNVNTFLFDDSTEPSAFKPAAGTWELAHLGFVVKDSIKMIEYYRKLGFAAEGPLQLPLLQPALNLWTIYGKTPLASPDFKMVIANFRNKSGTLQISANEPAGNILYHEFISQHGEGVQHIHFVVRDNLLPEKAKMEAAGFPCILTQCTDGGTLRETYYDTRAAGNVIIALMLPLPPGIGASKQEH